MSLKGQSAIEYLTTYGWMLLVIAIVGGAIFSTLQNSSQIQTTSGFANADVRVEEFGVTDSGFQAELRAASREQVENLEITLNNSETGISVTAALDSSVPVGDIETVTLEDIENSETTNTFDVKITYDEGGLENLQTEGTITGNLQINKTNTPNIDNTQTSITGKVSASPGWEDVKVELANSSGVVATDMTNTSGGYNFGEVNSGNYNISAAGVTADSVSISEATNIDFNLSGEVTKDGTQIKTFTSVGVSGCNVNGSTVSTKYPTSNGYRQVSTLEQLQCMNANLSSDYEMVQDINASKTANWNSEKGFAPVGPNNSGYNFRGNFNGYNNSIKDLYINRPNEDEVGLFGVIDKEVRNVGVENAYVVGDAEVGILAGETNGVDDYIYDSYTTGEVSGSDKIGGLVGRHYTGDIHRSYSSAEVSGNELVGGLVGISVSDIFSSYSTGDVNGTENVGGLTGINDNLINSSYSKSDVKGVKNVGGLSGATGRIVAGTVVQSYSSGNTTGSADVGGFIGKLEDPSIGSNTISDSYWNTESSGRSTSATSNSTGLTTSQMQGSSAETNMPGLDFQNTWDTVSAGYPELAWQD